jgi:hypothetical protein
MEGGVGEDLPPAALQHHRPGVAFELDLGGDERGALVVEIAPPTLPR